MNYSIFIFILGSVGAFYEVSDIDRDILNEYLEKFSKTVQSKNLDAISQLFKYSFSFNDCKREYNKNQVVEKLMSLPSDNKIAFNVTWIYPFAAENIVFKATVTGLGAAPMDVTLFLINRGVRQNTPRLTKRGSVNNCKK